MLHNELENVRTLEAGLWDMLSERPRTTDGPKLRNITKIFQMNKGSTGFKRELQEQPKMQNRKFLIHLHCHWIPPFFSHSYPNAFHISRAAVTYKLVKQPTCAQSCSQRTYICEVYARPINYNAGLHHKCQAYYHTTWVLTVTRLWHLYHILGWKHFTLVVHPNFLEETTPLPSPKLFSIKYTRPYHTILY